jgi:hypothetical protein
MRPFSITECETVLRDMAFEIAPRDRRGATRGKGRVAGTIRDIALIALAWVVLAGVIFFPATQLIGILTCAIALTVCRPRANRVPLAA